MKHFPVSLVPLASINVAADRQRQEIEVTDLVASIAAHGLLQPIIIDDARNLIAGERRLTACRELGWTEIPATFLSALSSFERKVVEFEENQRRKALKWQEETLAIFDLFEAGKIAEGDAFTQVELASRCGVSKSFIGARLELAPFLLSGHERILAAPDITSATTLASRHSQRQVAEAINSIAETSGEAFAAVLDIEVPSDATVTPVASLVKPASESVIQGDFLLWAEDYTGPKFNLIHCDFPYGINLHKGNRSVGTDASYDDSPEVFNALLAGLIMHQRRIIAPSCHIMFWCPADVDFHTTLAATFRRTWPEEIFRLEKIPLVWFKSDNAGSLPDPRRGPRRVYETAFLISLGDRKILDPVANCYAGPTGNLHQSEKPEAMLKHFFRMLVDNTTVMLDPTCGAGSSLRAAESLGAKHVLGLERDPSYAATARNKLRELRSKRAAEKVLT